MLLSEITRIYVHPGKKHKEGFGEEIHDDADFGGKSFQTESQTFNTLITSNLESDMIPNIPGRFYL